MINTRINKGVTLIALIITIVVLVIIGAATIGIVGENGIIRRAQQTKFLSDVGKYKEELELYKSTNKIDEYLNNRNEINTLSTWEYEPIKGYIKSYSKRYENKIGLIDGKLAYRYIGNDKEREWAEQLGLHIQEENATIILKTEGLGTISSELMQEGSILAKVGQEITITAINGSVEQGEEKAESTFKGWYSNGTIVSTDPSYTFKVAGDQILTAVFETDATLIYYLEGEEEKVLLDKTTDLSTYTSSGIDKIKITRVEFGTNCTTIGKSAFEGCINLGLTSLPTNIESIGNLAFAYCTNLRLTSLPSKLKSIGEFAFSECKSITIEEIPESVTALRRSTFSNCAGIKKLKISNFSNITGIYITFEGCTGLEELVLGDINKPVTKISDVRMLERCSQSNLTIKIYVPSGTTSLSGEPWGATNATIEYYDATTGELVNMALGQRYRGNKEINFTELPNADKISKIKTGAFEGCTNLMLTSLPPNIESIGNLAFAYCTNLRLTSLPSKLKSIGEFAFSECKSITIEEIPESVTALRRSTFSNCAGIKKLKISNFSNITGIYITFEGCTGLEELVLGDINKPVTKISDVRMLERCSQSNLTIKIYVPPSGTTSLSGEPWGATNATIEYYDATTGELVNMALGQRYRGNKEINFTELPNADKISKIKTGAFEGCTNLMLTSLPPNIESIGNLAFAYCTNLRLTSLPSKLKSIGEFAFSGCKSITIEEIPESVTALRRSTFSNCAGIKKLKISNFSNITGIYITFEGCTGLEELVLGDINKPVTKISDVRMLERCSQSNLTIKIYVPSGTTSLSGEPWGATNATVEYYDATTGKKIN